eukprot:364635-Chlamydomonas_euryale.AAC.2
MLNASEQFTSYPLSQRHTASVTVPQRCWTASSLIAVLHRPQTAPHQAVGGVPTVPGGVADGARFWRPSRGGRAGGRASGDGRATGRATRASDRRQGARDRHGRQTVWRPVYNAELRPTCWGPSPSFAGLLRPPSWYRLRKHNGAL